MRRAINLMLTIMFIICTTSYAQGATRLIYENFDDQALDSRLRVYGRDWTALSPPSYNLTSVGHGGTGYCFSSGTNSSAYLNWGVLGIGNVPNPWPSDEMYVSYWMRYPTYTNTNTFENFKFFYPHWNGTNNAFELSYSSGDGAFFCLYKNSGAANYGWLTLPGQTSGGWHHYEMYVKFSTGVARFWYDGSLKIDRTIGSWTGSVYYISAPSIDADAVGTFSRQIDDWEVWDGMPNSSTPPTPADTTAPARPSGVTATIIQ